MRLQNIRRIAFSSTGYVFRFVSILGERYPHGHVFDFYKQLLEHPDYLKVLGNGSASPICMSAIV
jgi:hypothetical protein